jgi:hypothetical protein
MVMTKPKFSIHVKDSSGNVKSVLAGSTDASKCSRLKTLWARQLEDPTSGVVAVTVKTEYNDALYTEVTTVTRKKVSHE